MLLNVTALSLGIETAGDVMTLVVDRNTAIPCKKWQTVVLREPSLSECPRSEATDAKLFGETKQQDSSSNVSSKTTEPFKEDSFEETKQQVLSTIRVPDQVTEPFKSDSLAKTKQQEKSNVHRLPADAKESSSVHGMSEETKQQDKSNVHSKVLDTKQSAEIKESSNSTDRVRCYSFTSCHDFRRRACSDKRQQLFGLS